MSQINDNNDGLAIQWRFSFIRDDLWHLRYYTLHFDIQSRIGSLAAASRLLNVAKTAQLMEHIGWNKSLRNGLFIPTIASFSCSRCCPGKIQARPRAPGSATTITTTRSAWMMSPPSYRKMKNIPSYTFTFVFLYIDIVIWVLVNMHSNMNNYYFYYYYYIYHMLISSTRYAPFSTLVRAPMAWTGWIWG